jgi:RNA methyltransferase, TrmH family
MTRITSRQHPFVRLCRELTSGRGAPDQVLLDGEHLVEEALAARLPVRGLLASPRAARLAAAAASRGVQVFEGSDEIVAAASPVRTTSGVVAVATWAPRSATDLIGRSSPHLIGLVDIQDPGNVGSIVRTADALGVSGVLMLDATARPGGWKALRGAMGSTFRVPIGTGFSAEAIEAARREGVTIAAAVAVDGVPIDQATLDVPWLLLVGNEGSGLPRSVVEAADIRLTIPMRKGVNSLNVGTGAALLLWEALGAHRHRENRP